MSLFFREWIYPGSHSIKVDGMLLFLRIGFGGLMLLHGWAKLNDVLMGKMQFADPIGMGEEWSLYLTVFAEFFCSLLLILGLVTRLALIPLIVTMFVAIFIVLRNTPIAEKDTAILYAIIFLVILLLGPGRYSIDHKIFRHL
jgi:putative oxidoreductase